MRSWVNFFAYNHKRFFKDRAYLYLQSKGLSLDEWTTRVVEGRRGDILALYALTIFNGSAYHCPFKGQQNLDLLCIYEKEK